MQSAFRRRGNLNGTTVLAEKANAHQSVTVAGIQENARLAFRVFERDRASNDVFWLLAECFWHKECGGLAA